MLTATRDLPLATAMIGSYPRPRWFDRSLAGRDFRLALGDDELFREQYLDAVAVCIGDQDRAGLDVFTDGDARFDLSVGGKGWWDYVAERLEGIDSRAAGSAAFARFNPQPGQILWEVRESMAAKVVVDRLGRGPLRYADLWRAAQRMSAKPVKFGAISAQVLAGRLRNEHYATDRELLFDLCDILNAELRELAAAGCPVVQVEEPSHHTMALQPSTTAAELRLQTEAVNRLVRGVEAEIWVHTCWGNPNQQRLYWEVPSYPPAAVEELLQLDADVVTFECASSGGRDLACLGRYRTDKKIGIGVVSHTTTTVEPPTVVADLIRTALEHIPPERLVVTPDCGFGREGISRRIAYYKLVSLVQGTNLVRRELGLPEAPVRAADPRLAFDFAPGPTQQ
jgi:5-methyltetrahydropteroyltriglutamate--homocysteine methyltransferase